MAKQPPVGVAQQIAPNVRRILAPNASPMTYWGTNSYLVGDQHLALIDPGPRSQSHLEALLAAIGPGHVEAVLITHSHVDHSPLARAFDAPVYAFGDSLSGRSTIMGELVASGLSSGGEGVDKDFAPDRLLKTGERVSSLEWDIEAIHTPGHMGNHLCFSLGMAGGDGLFSGDHLMAWASSLVSPPDGDISDFMNSTAALASRPWSICFPGHGMVIENVAERLAWLREHRLTRERQILAGLGAPITLRALTAKIYQGAPKALLPAAERNLFAHLVDLHQRGFVLADPSLSDGAMFAKK